ncbi:MAG: type II toxin-antitoxin system VapC family toxin [Planctomycetota bacterium]
MPTMRVYVDTSVFGGVADEEFADPSRLFFERVGRGRFTLVVSTEVLRELSDAPEPVRAQFDEIPEQYLENIPVSPEVEALADAYIAEGVLASDSRSDALHVAAATVANADLIVSWNFRHIVNYDRISRYNAVNVLNGYRPIEIRSPAELAYDDQT